jgi:hypothetical protein
MIEYKKKFPLNKRLSDYAAIKIKYPDKIPIIIDSTLSVRRKYLVDSSLTLGGVMHYIQKHLDRKDSSSGLFLFHNGTLIENSTIIGSIDNSHSEDGFFYLTLMKENTFG